MHFSSLFLFVLATVGFATTLHAKEPKQQTPLIVTADRFESELEQSPVNVSVVTRQDIKSSGVTTLSQALQSLGQINVSDLFGITGARARIDMGGFGASGNHNTLVLLNGRRLNDVDLSGVNLSSIPLETIERIEILRGSGTVLYGDNAVGGVVNIITRTGFDRDPSSVSVVGGSFGTLAYRASLAGQQGNTAFYLSAENTSSDGYRDNSAFNNSNILVELTRQNGDSTYGVRALQNRENLRLPGYLNEPIYLVNPKAALGTAEYANQTEASIDGYYNGKHWRAELGLRDKKQDAVIFGTTQANLRTYSFTPRYRTNFGANKVVSGIDIYQSTLNTLANFGAPNINRSIATRNSYSLYVNDTIELAKNNAFTLGTRFQSVSLSIQNTNLSSSATTQDNRTDGLSAWEAAWSKRHHNGRSYLRVAQSVRFPVLDEMWNYFTGTIGVLRPQYGEHLELGTKTKLSEKTDIEGDLFHIRLKDEIGYVDATSSNVNFDPTRHQGINLSVSSQLHPRWKSRIGYSYRDAIFTNGTYSNKSIPEVPAHSATWNNTILLRKAGSISITAVYTGKRYFGDDLNNVGKKQTAYTRVDFSWNYRRNGWDLTMAVNNLTNIKTADRGYYAWWSANPYMYYPLPERSILVTLRKQL